MPSLGTLIALSIPLEVHPLRLLQLLFLDIPLPKTIRRAADGDRSAFLADVTYPDGTLVLPGETFAKTWRLENAGSVPWLNRKLMCLDDDIVVLLNDGEKLSIGAGLVPEAREVPVPDTLPGGQVDVSVAFTAPAQPCTVLSYWKMIDADGTPCFPGATGVWAKVQVVAPVASAGGGLADDLCWLNPPSSTPAPTEKDRL